MANSANSTAVLSRRPGILPGGDPFAPASAAQTQSLADGDITPRITVQIAGDPKGRRPDIKNFSLRADVQQLYDPFRFVLVDDDGQLQWLVDAVTSKILVPIKIFHKDPFVNNGVERPWMQGVITHVDVASGFSGSLLTVSGYDLGYLLTSCAPVGEKYNLLGASWQRIASLLIDPSWVQPNVFLGKQRNTSGKLVDTFGNNAWGIRSILGISLSRQIRQGRLDAETAKINKELAQAQRAQTRGEVLAANQINFKAYTPKVLVQPGETVADILIRYAKFAQDGNGPRGRLVNVSPEGDLEFFSPDYTTPPQYVANYNRNPDLAARNNMEDGQRTLDSEARANDVWCFGSILYGLAFYERDNPLYGMTRGHYSDYSDSKYYYRRRLTFADNERYDNDRAKQRAEWRYKQGVYNSDTVTLTATGHSQNGLPFAPNSRIDVRSDKLYCNEIRYVSAVEYRQEDRGDEGIASYTVLTCKKDKLLAA